MSNPETLPAGAPVADGSAQNRERTRLEGSCILVEPLDPAKHGESLWRSTGGVNNEDLWRYMHSGPFADRTAFDSYLREKAGSEDPLYFALIDRASRKATGHAAYMRIKPTQRVIEVGSIVFSRELQKTRAATEAMYLMARHVFEELHYRRYEWKCNLLNEASMKAARRLGFAFEGVFRQHMIVKGRSRDTAWFAMLDAEWPARRNEFERWLAPDNFDQFGRQKTPLYHE